MDNMGASRFRISRPNRRRFIVGALCGILLMRFLWTGGLLARTATHPVLRGTPGKIQADFSHMSHADRVLNEERAQAIKDQYVWAFKKYREVAWGKDEVLPVSGGFGTSRNGWGATLVDSLTTTMVMNLTTETELTIAHIVDKIDFTKAQGVVDPFETIIRYLGSMAAAVDLLDYGIVDVADAASSRAGLIRKAHQLGQHIGPGYDSPLGMMWPRVDFERSVGTHSEANIEPEISPIVTPARTGSNWLENFKMTQHTGVKDYYRNGTRSWEPLVFNKNKETFPGMIEIPIDLYTGESLGESVSIGAGHDSYYEYLIKAAVLARKDKNAGVYASRWETAMTSTRKHLAVYGTAAEQYRKYAGQQSVGYLFIGRYVDGTYMNEMGHLACYAAGNLIMGGRFLFREDLAEFGLQYLEACHAMYMTATGLGSESVVWDPVESSHMGAVSDKPAAMTPLSAGHHRMRREAESPAQRMVGAYDHSDQQPADRSVPSRQWAISTQGQHELDQIHHQGFWVSNARYLLRPEVVESYFYAYRATGDKKYQEWAWDMFQGLLNISKTTHGFAEIQDVTLPDGGGLTDNSESFFLAETMKYLYLIFDDPEHISLDEWVFTTEAHPLHVV
ncbi:glycoside hydrolase [Dipodascopsis tothii]|uniref:glycoside hydrolase n=1 Tax=Dipodascopsis tothii TaxID=44089 RepID=UPI0034CF4B61